MANTQVGNLFYIDSTGTLAKQALRIYSLTVAATSANAVLQLKDSSIAGTLVDLRIPTSGDTKSFFYRDQPLNFPNGLEVVAATNCVATAVIDFNRG